MFKNLTLMANIQIVEKYKQYKNDKSGDPNKNMLTDKPQMFTFSAAAPPRTAVLTASVPCSVAPRQNKELDRMPQPFQSSCACLKSPRRRSAPGLINSAKKFSIITKMKLSVIKTTNFSDINN
jgi:hypothetical protein